MRDVVHHFHKNPISMIAVGLTDEASIDFQVICDKIFQVAERGKVGSEVVERKAKACVAELVHQCLSGWHVRDYCCFCNFENHAVGRYSGVFEGSLDEVP